MLVALLLAVAIGGAQDRRPVLLPADPSTPGISLDYQGGFTGCRANKPPGLTVRAGGMVIATDQCGFIKKEIQIPPSEVQDLLRFDW